MQYCKQQLKYRSLSSPQSSAVKTLQLPACKYCLWESLLTLCASPQATLSRSVLFCFLLMVEEEVKEEERKCLHQCRASIFPSVRGEDWSLLWLISRLIWQDMFDLIKAFGRKTVPGVKAGKKIELFHVTKKKLNYLSLGENWTPPSFITLCASQRGGKGSRAFV